MTDPLRPAIIHAIMKAIDEHPLRDPSMGEMADRIIEAVDELKAVEHDRTVLVYEPLDSERVFYGPFPSADFAFRWGQQHLNRLHSASWYAVDLFEPVGLDQVPEFDTPESVEAKMEGVSRVRAAWRQIFGGD